MEMRNLCKLFFLIFTISVIIPVISCSQRITDFTIISSKNIDLSRAAQFKRTAARVKDEDVVFVLIGIPFGQPNLKEAMDRAIQKTPGAVALVDGVVYQKIGGCYPYLGTYGYIIEGSPLLDPKLMAGKTLPSNYILAVYNKDTDSYDIKYVSKAEYLRVSKLYKKDSNILERL